MSFRQVEQRHVSSEITLMEWSPTMDLIALATAQGEVLLHRLSWQKVWSCPAAVAKDEEVKVMALAWRPDGRVLGVAYNTGKLTLLDVENAEVLHMQEINAVICCLHWAEHRTIEGEVTSKSSFYTDNSALFLPKYSSLVKNYSSSGKQEEIIEDSKRLKDQENMNLLVVGTENGLIHIYAFGIFPCGWFHVDPPEEAKTSKVLSVSMSPDLNVVITVLETPVGKGNMAYHYKSFNLPLMHRKTEEFKVISLKYGQIASLLTVLLTTIHAISEAWEDILLEIDAKLLNYAMEKRNVSKASISDDFLELLMFGTPSDSLEKFLLHDLTENGLKKFGHSIELSYSNIQKLVLKKLQTVATSLYYHLSDLKGMALWQERFGELGLSFESVTDALSSVGSFLTKATEIQQVIDSSMKNFKAFFRWLYSVILRLSDEPIPTEITKLTQQDLSFVAEFLKENFAEEWNSDRSSVFKLERIGQYLKDEVLTLPPVVTDNPWIAFLDKNSSLKEADVIFPYHRHKSLVQQHADICKSIEMAFNGPWNVFSKFVEVRNNYILCKHYEGLPFKISHAPALKNNTLLSVFTKEAPPADLLYVMRESLHSVDDKKIGCLALTFGELPCYLTDNTVLLSYRSDCYSHKIFEAKFYNAETLTLLLLENTSSKIDCPVLLQLQLKSLPSIMEAVKPGPDGTICWNFPNVDAELFGDRAGHKRLENIRAVSLAVSGPRKVASVLFASRRQVRLFEMEVEDGDYYDDDDDDEDDDLYGEESSIKEFPDKEEPMTAFCSPSFQDRDSSP